MELPEPTNELQRHLLSLLPPGTSPARLEVLYSDYSASRALNPPGHAANVAFWAGFLRGILGEGLQKSLGSSKVKEGKGKDKEAGEATTTGVPDYLVLHADDSLLAALRLPRLGAPYGLPVALETLVSPPPHPAVLIRRDLYLASPKSIYDKKGWAEWIWGGVKGGVGWGFGMVGLRRQLEGEEAAEKRWEQVKGDWVHIPLLEQAAESLWELISARPSLSSADRLCTRGSLRADILDWSGLLDTGETPSSDADLEVMIKYLQRDKKRLVVQGEIIKFAPKGGFQLWEDTQISELDKGIVEIRETTRQLELQISALETQIAARTAKAKSYLAESPPNKTLATTHLRIRASLASVLDKRLSTLLTLRKVCDSIAQSSSDAELVKVYNVSATTLKILSDRVGGGEEVEKTRERLEDALAGEQEVSEAISGVGATEQDPELDEKVEKELAALIKQEEEAATTAEQEKAKAKEKEKEPTPTKELEDRLKALKPPTAAQAEQAKAEKQAQPAV